MYKNQLLRFLDYLGTGPRINELCAHLIDDFALAHQPKKIRITWKGTNNCLSVISEYGYEYTEDRPASLVGRSFEFTEWNTSPTEGYDVITGRTEGPWSQEGQVYVHKITREFLTVGFIKIIFEDMDEAKRHEFQQATEMLLSVLALYINLEMTRIHTLAITEGQITASANGGLDSKTRFSLLTPRQVQILGLIGQRKTNAQIGKTLGYATTTIHAECSDIYQALAVGNRTQAFDLVKEFLE